MTCHVTSAQRGHEATLVCRPAPEHSLPNENGGERGARTSGESDQAGPVLVGDLPSSWTPSSDFFRVLEGVVECEGPRTNGKSYENGPGSPDLWVLRCLYLVCLEIGLGAPAWIGPIWAAPDWTHPLRFAEAIWIDLVHRKHR